MPKLFITILSLFICLSLSAQENEIRGFAPDFVGEKVELLTYQDYVTMTEIKIGEGFVDPKDSIFHIPLKNTGTFKGKIQIAKTEAPLYIAPNSTYELYFPKAENQPISFQNQRTDIMFFGLDSTDINYRIVRHNQWFDAFVAYHEKDIARGQFLTYLDTFSVYAAEAYKDVKDEFFITYVRYNIAEMQQTFGGNKKSEARLETFLNYIKPFPVYYENDQYMKFFRGFYSQNFSDYAPTIEAEINVAIEKASPTKLMAALKTDLFLSNPEVREVVMIDQLGKQYYKRNDQKRNILVMLDSLSNHAKYQVNATISKNVLSYLTSLEPGFPAPTISLDQGADEDPITWRKYQGKFVYVNFFETWNDQAVAEMKIMIQMAQKYGEFVSFLSLCTDKDEASFEKFKAANPEMDWDICYIGQNSPIKSDFRVKVVPTYFLIDQSGFIAVAPAASPTPDGEYESIDQTFHFIKTALTPSSRNQIGQP